MDTRRTLWSALVCACLVASPTARADEGQLPQGEYQKLYSFSTDWFSRDISLWKHQLGRLRGKPELRYLEVGPYEGRSFFWVVDNLLTDPTSRATAIDIFEKRTSTHYEESYESTFRSNVALSGAADRITVIKGRSQVELRYLPLESFDLIYIDGSHAPNDVLTDAVLAWGLLKLGGIVIFDDYAWQGQWPRDLRPQMAIDSFLSLFGRETEVLSRKRQLIVRKRPDRCLEIHYEGCSYFRRYLFDWRGRGGLIDPTTGEKLALTSEERLLVEKLLKSKKLGYPEIVVDKATSTSKTFIQLRKKLELEP